MLSVLCCWNWEAWHKPDGGKRLVCGRKPQHSCPAAPRSLLTTVSPHSFSLFYPSHVPFIPSQTKSMAICLPAKHKLWPDAVLTHHRKCKETKLHPSFHRLQPWANPGHKLTRDCWCTHPDSQKSHWQPVNSELNSWWLRCICLLSAFKSTTEYWMCMSIRERDVWMSEWLVCLYPCVCTVESTCLRSLMQT